MSSEMSSPVNSPGQSRAAGLTIDAAGAAGVDPGSGSPEGELSLDVTFELLQNPRRRSALRYLADNPTTTLSTLAEHLAAQENDKSVQMLSSAERKRVYISLYQCHLPKLDDAGVIEFDSNRGTVERTRSADHFVQYLDQVAGSEEDPDRPAWHYYYLGIALTGGGLLAAQLALLPTPTAAAAVAGAVIVVLASLAIVHLRHETAARSTSLTALHQS